LRSSAAARTRSRASGRPAVQERRFPGVRATDERHEPARSLMSGQTAAHPGDRARGGRRLPASGRENRALTLVHQARLDRIAVVVATDGARVSDEQIELVASATSRRRAWRGVSAEITIWPTSGSACPVSRAGTPGRPCAGRHPVNRLRRLIAGSSTTSTSTSPAVRHRSQRASGDRASRGDTATRF